MEQDLMNAQTRVGLAYASGTADRNGITIDTAGYEAAKIVVHVHSVAAGATTSVKVQQGAASNMSDAADLEGTSISIADDDDGQVFIIGLIRPRERYIRVVVDKDASNATAESATVELYGRRVRPSLASVTDETTVETHVSPAEGTA